MYTETEIKELIEQTVSLIPEHTWPVVADQLSARIVDTMPSEILEQLTGNPTGFEEAGKVCRLNMALEGTKQAAHLWQQNLNKFMVDFGFTRSLADPCLYIMREGEIVLLSAVHVDDILTAYNDNELYEKFWTAFSKQFKSTRGPVDTLN